MVEDSADLLAPEDVPLLRAHSPKADVAHNHDHATNAPYIP